MSILDRLVAAVTPAEKDADRVNARELARSLAQPGDWLSLVLDHHLAIEAAFDACRAARTGPDRSEALRGLQLLLTGHTLAKEAVLYPAMTTHDQQGGAAMAFGEQQAIKVHIAQLEAADPTSQAWIDKLGQIEGAVKHQFFEEEGMWFARMKQASLHDEQIGLKARYNEEFTRYVGPEVAARFDGRHVGATGLGTMPYKEAPLDPDEPERHAHQQ